ncbi:signal peptidase I [Arthrobacter crystallopoietes BAB-32]|uniref:Signal peptidase I n=1 Tax=Arthrobacter crystallopoietes BAB-32 TaxID=1246476 RepID=N1V2U5_9MICC|nr:signal peptidase I [Arthrobacter crystallopoietes]EMY34294.1 signal peptidase I [Arthrobacter crystallopoietes BAB-32]
MSTGKHRRRSERSGALWWLGQISSWTLFLAAVGILLALVVVPRATGSTPYTVLTGSMAPGMPPGTLVVSKPVEPADLQAGDVITYQLHSGEPEVVTHRILSTANSLDGQTAFITQGDANAAPDREPVQPGQIRGAVWYSVPWAGYVNTWLTGEQRIWITGGAVVLLAGYTLCMFLGATLDAVRNRRRRQATTGEESYHGAA